MGSIFNNPRVIIPLALFSVVFLVYRTVPEAFDSLLNFLPTRSSLVQSESLLDPSTKDLAEPRAVEYMGALLRERWLPERWRQFAKLQRDPFVAGYVEPEEPEIPVIVADEEPPPPLPEDLATYIVENIGLDSEGYFVRFGSQRIREGEKLGSEVVRQIVVPDMTGAVALDALSELLPWMQLDATAPEANPPSVVIDGQLFLEGDLVLRRPVLAVGQVMDNKVRLLDGEGRYWLLEMDE
ncbi:MAG: hypothetical protein ACON39_00910 [Coraliomargaritaceae bacterium]